MGVPFIPPGLHGKRKSTIISAARFFVGAADFQILAPRLSVSIEELWLLPFARRKEKKEAERR